MAFVYIDNTIIVLILICVLLLVKYGKDLFVEKYKSCGYNGCHQCKSYVYRPRDFSLLNPFRLPFSASIMPEVDISKVIDDNAKIL